MQGTIFTQGNGRMKNGRIPNEKGFFKKLNITS